MFISDNGIGFDFLEEAPNDKSRLESGNGLANMKERVRIMNGKFSINSSSGKGTIIVAEIPKQ